MFACSPTVHQYVFFAIQQPLGALKEMRALGCWALYERVVEDSSGQ